MANAFPTLTRLHMRHEGFHAALDALLARQGEVLEGVTDSVRSILSAVKTHGDEALVDYTTRFDQLTLPPEKLRFSPEDIASATVEAPLHRALEEAATRIRDYHERMRPLDVDYTDALGMRLGARWTAVDAAGLYVPGGRAAYPSTVLMNAIPAQVAGVRRLVITVPTPKGDINPAILVAARIAGVSEIYRIGGAQAVAALAYGTARITPVDVIVGPGNAYVAEAKRQLYGLVGIDSIAGPSEILVVADTNTPANWIAADLLSQAEHDPQAASLLITDSAAHAEAVAQALETQLATLPRAAIARQSLENHGALLIVEDLTRDAPALIDRLAPEHLELAVDHPEALMSRIRHAGAIFIGRHTPEAVGDYIAGPSHVLPTSGTARFASGLSVTDFMKRTSFMQASPATLAALQASTQTLATAEGLEAHRRSIAIRNKS